MDVVVTLPLSFGIERWIDEGDPVGSPWSGQEWGFTTSGMKPKIEPGERVYVVYGFRLIGYAPLIRLETSGWRLEFVRGGGAVAVTIPERIVGFRGWRYRWWEPSAETPCTDWARPYVKQDAKAARWAAAVKESHAGD